MTSSSHLRAAIFLITTWLTFKYLNRAPETKEKRMDAAIKINSTLIEFIRVDHFQPCGLTAVIRG